MQNSCSQSFIKCIYKCRRLFNTVQSQEQFQKQYQDSKGNCLNFIPGFR
ncbi:hypothetical protein pb186bvf_005056 [Paramecium bursaria]